MKRTKSRELMIYHGACIRPGSPTEWIYYHLYGYFSCMIGAKCIYFFLDEGLIAVFSVPTFLYVFTSKGSFTLILPFAAGIMPRSPKGEVPTTQ